MYLLFYLFPCETWARHALYFCLVHEAVTEVGRGWAGPHQAVVTAGQQPVPGPLRVPNASGKLTRTPLWTPEAPRSEQSWYNSTLNILKDDRFKAWGHWLQKPISAREKMHYLLTCL